MNKSLKAIQSLKQMFSKNRNMQGMLYFPTTCCFEVRHFQVSENKYLEALNLQLVSVLDKET